MTARRAPGPEGGRSRERRAARHRAAGTEAGQGRAVYVISVAAELAGVHPQTLRIYERKGLLAPARTPGNTRRYSEADIARLRMIQRLTQEFGINLAGVQMIIDMEEEVERLRRRSAELVRELEQAQERLRRERERLERERPRTQIVPVRRAAGPRVIWRAASAGEGGSLERAIT
jgi:MerR family transcriptional regulator/heat shock protein HspR